MAIRSLSPSELIHQKILQRYDSRVNTTSPVSRRWPSGLVATLALALDTNRMRVNRWLNDPRANPLTWDELCGVAEEAGGSLRCLFSVRHQ